MNIFKFFFNGICKLRFFLCFCTALVLLLPAVVRASDNTDSTLKPNIIFILADDLGYGDVGMYGQQKIKTPHIDQLAKEGMRFTQFYSGSPVCAPARSSFMTGQHTGHTPIRGNKETRPEGQWPLPAEAVTVAEVLKTAGYTTAAFGKWGLGFVETPGNPLKQGFDRFYGYNCQALAHNYFPAHLWDNNKKILLNNTPANQVQYAPDMIQEQALGFIEDNSNRPFEYYKKLFNEKPVKVNDDWNGVGYQPQPYPHAAYAAMVAKLDNYVGQVIDKLKRLHLDRNTLIIFASDNGPHVEGGNDPAFFNSSAGLRGTKRDLYEGGIRTPFITTWPGSIPAGTTSAHVGAFWDLLPTFAELSDAKTPPNIDGISIVPAMLGKAGQKQHLYLYWEFHELGGRQAVRLNNWKGVKYRAAANIDSPIELYDLFTDRGEQNNVANQHPKIIKQMAEIMQSARVDNPDFPFYKK